MHECGEADDCQQDESEAQAVELSIVILVDGEEKCCSKVGRSAKGVNSCASSQQLNGSSCPSCQSSRATTPCNNTSAIQQSASSTSLPCCNKKNAAGSVCGNKRRCPHHHECPFEANANQCGKCGQPRIVPTPQSNCPCAAYQNAPCGAGAPLVRVKSQTAACQTISHGECQTDPMAVQMPNYMPCQTPVQAQVQTAQSATRIQTASCQTGTDAPQVQSRPCTPKPKKCCKKAKTAICQTHAQPKCASRPQTADQVVMVQTTVETGQPVCAPPPPPAYHQPSQQQICPPPPTYQQSQQLICPPLPTCQQPQPVCQPTTITSTLMIQQGGYPAAAGEQAYVQAQQDALGGQAEPGTEGLGEKREDRVRKVRRSSKEEKHRDTAETRRARKSSLPPEQLNFTQPPGTQLNFVDYFLKSEGGVASVITLAETKLEYEKKCKHVLANMPNHKRSQAEEFFNKIIEAIQTKVPESNNTEIKHYHLSKYIHPIVTTLQLDAQDEMHTINKYHHYILSVVNFMEDRLRERQVINPDAMIDVETHLLAGIMSRFYPLFIKIKEAVLRMAKSPSETNVPPEDFVKQLRKLILAIYVEIVCIDVTFNNTLTSLTYLPSVEVQEKYRQQMAIRKKHARHSVTWAARCLTTTLLYYYVSGF